DGLTTIIVLIKQKRMNKLDRWTRRHLIAFGIYAACLLAWLCYSNMTGSRIWGGNETPQAWGRSGPGYHK
ncbi:MAG: hypothetical protein RLY16_510, partial [Bacteroidota bacterium]